MQSVRSKHAILFIYYCLPLTTIVLIVSYLCLSMQPSLNFPSRHPRPVQRDAACNAEGNADLYGIGVRIGFYTQSIGSFISLTLKRESNLMNTYWLHLALLVVIVYNSIRLTTTPGQVMISINLLSILFWFEQYILVGVDFDTVQSPDDLPQMTFKLAASTFLFLCMSCHAIWFWWRGLDILPRGECGDKAFFFYRVDLHGWFRTLGKCFSILGLAKAGLDIVSIVRFHIRQTRETETDRHSSKDRILTPGFMQVLARYGTSSFAKILLFIMLSSFSIITIELGIIWNKLQSVNTIETLSSLGQLVPLIIGLGTFAEALCNLIQHYKTKPRENSTRDGTRTRRSGILA
ncbi:hypothetical protein F4813DRAFT_8607 [Daldinia decipiens]|uniref:uncharacterized protein n=1 Tax=Daldinia decipiens TaxID=326647 RepID=UPI0020C5293F|nr:uncharacterized protein F4813DRAFT_8607 [Daldinia decipiens]KAI1662726.1 hypothetical protein F4813DRAFT_8607 [Daldinia decipiens]